MKKSSRRRPRKRICPPPPANSLRTYVRIDPSNIAMFRFLLEGHDNLGIFTVTDKFKGILMLRYSPHQKQDMKKFIRQIATEMDIEVVM